LTALDLGEVFSSHSIVSSSSTARPCSPSGGRWIRHWKTTWSTVCSSAPHSQARRRGGLSPFVQAGAETSDTNAEAVNPGILTFSFCHGNTNVGVHNPAFKNKKHTFLQLQFITKTTLKL